MIDSNSDEKFDALFTDFFTDEDPFFGKNRKFSEEGIGDFITRLKVNLTKKTLWMYILRLLSRRRALYGYEIQSAIQEEFDWPDTVVGAMSQVSMYKELYRMSKEGLVVSKVTDDSSRRRRYYFITPKGVKILGEAKKFIANTYETLFGRDSFEGRDNL